MANHTETRRRINDFIQKTGLATVHQIATKFDISRQMTHRHLNQLITHGLIRKIGSRPRVFYLPADAQLELDTLSITLDHKNL